MKTFVMMVLLGGSFLLMSTARADDDAAETAAMVKQFGLISPEEAGQKALAAKPGVIKEVDLDDRDFSKGWDYEIEIVDADAVEWEILVDAKSGEVRHISRDWF
ncbi:MAG TPA: PepSY domain-containing protein [Methylophilaceae bacterium]|nr:PepSY domain-containing protein [Methylophilaceae bacterium]